MKIVIPEEYRAHFQEDTAYLTWWMKPTLLLMNREEGKSFQEMLQRGAWVRYKGGSCKHIFLPRPMIELAVTDGVIDIPTPEDPTRRLQGDNRTFTRAKAGFILS